VDRDEFRARVRREEESARARPRLYRLRVTAFAGLGYAVYLAIILALLLLIAGFAALMVLKPGVWVFKIGWKLGIPTCLGVVALVKALRVRLTPPSGYRLSKSDAPQFFELLENLRRKLRAPQFESVFLTDDYNAGVLQIPRWGVLGSRNFLQVGMPLMQAISTRDLEAVLSHELGHLSANHSRFAGWIYHIVGSYEAVLQASGENKLLSKFLGWYVPRLDVLTFPLRRQDEYEADRAAVEVVGAERAAQALVNVDVRGTPLEPFWKSIRDKVHESPSPPAYLFTTWRERCREFSTEGATEALEAALNIESDVDDTHPSLRERVAAMGGTAAIEAQTGASSAEELFGDRYAHLVEQAGYVWVQGAMEAWKTEHQRLVDQRTRLAELERVRHTRALTEDEAFAYADAAEDVLPDQDPLPFYRAVIELFPEHAGARLAAGRLLADRGDEEAVKFLDPMTRTRDADLRLAASLWIARYHERSGNSKDVETALKRVNEAFQEKEQLDEARAKLKTSDTFLPHGLPAERVEELRKDLELLPFLKRAYLVRKEISAEESAFVLAIVSKATARLKDSDDDGRTQRTLGTVTLPPESWVLNLDAESSFTPRIEKVEGALVFTAK
jgi:Zn-dependent protease with chaperone function